MEQYLVLCEKIWGPLTVAWKHQARPRRQKWIPETVRFSTWHGIQLPVLRLSAKELYRTGNASKHSRSHITQRPNFLYADTLFKETFCLYISRIMHRRIVEELLVGNIIVSLTELFNTKHNNSNRAQGMENTSCVTWKSSRTCGKIRGNSRLITPTILWRF